MMKMRVPSVNEVMAALCTEYRVHEIPDSSRAWNGPQVIPSPDSNCNKVMTATDASLEVIHRAVNDGADLLIVHHGLTWTLGAIPLPSSNEVEAERVRVALANNLAILALHLPMDAHPILGNNAILADGLGIQREGTWFASKGHPSPLDSSLIQGPSLATEWPQIDTLEDGRLTMEIGLYGRFTTPMNRSEIKSRIQHILGKEQTEPEIIRIFPEDRGMESDETETIAICSGAAGGAVVDAKEPGVDALLSGEGPFQSAILAQEADISLILAGHHATETVGPRATADWLNRIAEANEWSMDTQFISAPIGL
ncbi:MAG TPA: Nif3-like dinuclear metal center hexameric protein [Candidatus Poseidoniales archaeon]|nr:MAG TPA: Nif3-like dinuclear metal center hexameric protein [Candidatus Poseidoniales archaeon]